jgi:hypothetical protein
MHESISRSISCRWILAQRKSVQRLAKSWIKVNGATQMKLFAVHIIFALSLMVYASERTVTDWLFQQ